MGEIPYPHGIIKYRVAPKARKGKSQVIAIEKTCQVWNPSEIPHWKALGAGVVKHAFRGGRGGWWVLMGRGSRHSTSSINLRLQCTVLTEKWKSRGTAYHPLSRGMEAGYGWKETHEGETGVPSLLSGLLWGTRTWTVLAREEPRVKIQTVDIWTPNLRGPSSLPPSSGVPG